MKRLKLLNVPFLGENRFYGRHSWRCYAIMGIASLSSLDDVGKK